jgi:ABC-type nitrate/sulfonate/bicarbonate transport system substrate-binding protein
LKAEFPHLKRLILAVVTLAIILALAWGSWACSRGGNSGPPETLNIGNTPFETNALLLIAEERGYFSTNQLNVVLHSYDSGVAAVEGLLKQEVDLATCAEFVVVGFAFKQADIGTVAVIDRFKNVYLAARKDRGIQGIADLQGKRVGVTFQSSDEFYFGRFLELNGMKIQQVSLANITRAQSVGKLASSEVDAVVFIQPHVNIAEKELGDNLVVWPIQSGQLNFFNLAARNTWIKDHPEVVTRLIKALIQAEEYIVKHPEQAQDIIQKRLNYDEAYVNEIWPEHQLAVTLDQSMILAMEDEARWLISNNLTSEKTVPDFRAYIYSEGLKAVKPEAVNIR